MRVSAVSIVSLGATVTSSISAKTNYLVVGADEEIFEMNNGCICCTVRGDLIRIIAGLMKRAQGFDGILIETTGLADPGPVAQTFFADRDCKLDSSYRATSPADIPTHRTLTVHDGNSDGSGCVADSHMKSAALR